MLSHHKHHKAHHNKDPSTRGTFEEGWKRMPEVEDAEKYEDWVVDAEAGAVIPLYQTANQDNNAIKRAIIVLHGQQRDAWSYWNAANNALYKASAEEGVNRDEISIMAPCWFNETDLEAGAAKDNQLLWGNMTCVSGHYNVGPSSVSKFSSYKVLDALVDQYLNQSAYPNLEKVVIVGHSAGGQMTQRYAALRASTKDDDRVMYWVANPGSLLWLTTDRPHPNRHCEDVDSFKYGLSDKIPGYATKDFKQMGRDGVVQRYLSRTICYAWGLADTSPGDSRPAALTQGKNHVERGRNFVAMLEGMEGGMPRNQTVDWVEGVAHDHGGMMGSKAGIEKIFKHCG